MPKLLLSMYSKPKVSVVILNYNGKGFLEKFLPFVMQSTYANKDIIVADNASTDDSVSFLRSRYPEIRLIIHECNEGFAKGYNLALNQIESDYYVLLNSDVEVTPSWIEPIVDLMEQDSSIAACQPKLLDYNNRAKFEYAGASGGWMDMLGFPFLRGRVMDHIESDLHQYDNAEPCFWASGAALFVKAGCFREVGGLDDFLFAHQEEIDFCWRLQLAGYKVYVEPHSVVYHVGGGTLPPSNRKIFLNFRNNLIMICKNLPVGQLLWKLPVRICLNKLAAIKFLTEGKPGYCWAVFQAHAQFLIWMFFKRAHSVFPKSRKPSAKIGWYRGSIVWDYFAGKKHTFSEIIGNK